MKKTSLLFSLITYLFLASFVFAADNPVTSPQKTDDSYAWDFGKVKAGDKPKHDFILKNEGKTTINIKEVSTTCGCTTSKLQKNVLEPGESTVVEIAFNSKGYSGGVQKYAYVRTDNNEAAINLSVDGMLGKAAEPVPSQASDNSVVRLTIKGEIEQQETTQ